MMSRRIAAGYLCQDHGPPVTIPNKQPQQCGRFCGFDKLLLMTMGEECLWLVWPLPHQLDAILSLLTAAHQLDLLVCHIMSWQY